jgi:hypothetical protein
MHEVVGHGDLLDEFFLTHSTLSHYCSTAKQSKRTKGRGSEIRQSRARATQVDAFGINLGPTALHAEESDARRVRACVLKGTFYFPVGREVVFYANPIGGSVRACVLKGTFLLSNGTGSSFLCESNRWECEIICPQGQKKKKLLPSSHSLSIGRNCCICTPSGSCLQAH